MAERDQEMRSRQLVELEYWDDSVDRENMLRMKAIVSFYGWPTIAKVGSVASYNAWLLVQHADQDNLFQARCLTLMKSEPAHEVARPNIAMLEDRVRTNQNRPQLYGTQFCLKNDGTYALCEIEDLERVDERRLAMELGTLAEGIATWEKKYRTHE
jgi:hypothetical protein